jgi:hypothetical protein
MTGLLVGIFLLMLAGFVFVLAQLWSACVGMVALAGTLFGEILFAAALILRLPLLLTLGAFWGAYQVWQWPLWLALIFAAPGLLWLIPPLVAALGSGLMWALGGGQQSWSFSWRTKPKGEKRVDGADRDLT